MLQLPGLSKQLRCARGCKAGFAAGTMARIWCCRIWWVFQTLTESPMIKEVGRNAGTGCLLQPCCFPDVWDPAWHGACFLRFTSSSGTFTKLF